MSKELDEYYKMCSYRTTEIDDTPLVKVMDGGKFKMLSIEEYEEMTNKLADLEAKLAESEKRCKKAYQEGLLQKQFDKDMEIDQLKQQLANKDKEIEERMMSFEKRCQEYYKSKEFTIEQLEKVKEKLLEELQSVTDLLDPLEYEDYHEFIGCCRGYKNSIEEIDNQIKQLKELQ